MNRGVEALSANPIVKINCDPSNIVNEPAQSKVPSRKSHQNEKGKLIRASHPTQTVHRVLPLKTKPTEMNEGKRNNPIAQAKSTTGRVTQSQAAPLSNPSTSSGFRTSPSIQKRPATQATGIATRRHRLHGVSSSADVYSLYQPPENYRKPTLDQRSIAARLRKRSCRGEQPKPLIKTEENLLSEDASYEGSENSSAPVYRKDHSAVS